MMYFISLFRKSERKGQMGFGSTQKNGGTIEFLKRTNLPRLLLVSVLLWY